MIEQHIINGVPATVAYLKGDMEPCDKAEHTFIKVHFADGRIEFAYPQKQTLDYDPDEPRDTTGKWTNGAETLYKAPADREQWPDHIKALKVPPAWTDVKINSNPNAALLASGKDSKGRSVYTYSAEFRASQSAMKFARISELSKKAEAVFKQNEANRSSTDPLVKENADALSLIMKMGLRPGSTTDTKAKVQAYGATTLEGRHVISDGKSTRLLFTGKKGVHLDLPVEDKETAEMLRARALKAGPDGKLFPNTSDDLLRDYTHSLDGGGFKTKDFRTYLGTSTAAKLVAIAPVPKNEQEYKKAVMTVAKLVSSKLGNTPIIALQSYIDPRVFAPWRHRAPK